MPEKTQKIIFDANFFICMNSIHAKDFLSNLKKVGEELGYDYYISERVFHEIKASSSFLEEFKEVVNIHEIQDDKIEKIKNKLKSFNIRFPAQDPDLSLIVLGDKLLHEDSNSNIVHLVTDDFKLVKNTNLIYYGKINTLSLSSFLLKIQRSTTKKVKRNYFKNIWKKSLNYTLSYVIERSNIYPAEQKIQWLIERAVAVTEDSIITQDSRLTKDKTVKFKIVTKKFSEQIAIAEKFLENQNLPQSEEEMIQDIIIFLENLKIAREYVKRARESIVKNETKEAVKFLKKGNGFLISLLQLASGRLEKINDYEIVEQLICSEISKMEFLRSFLLVSLGRVSTSIDSLERAALFSTIIHNYQTCLTLNYLKALILLFHSFFDEAIKQYNFTEELAEIYHDDKLKLKCLIGKAIALYLQGGEDGDDKRAAMAIMEDISNINFEENFLDSIIVFTELGDYFLALGHSQIATNLYNQALEISIDYNLDLKCEILIEKLKRAYISTVLDGYSTDEMEINLDRLLDKAYSVKNVEKYNDQIKKISGFNKLFYEPFPHIKGKRKTIPYKNLPKELQNDYLEVVHIEKKEKPGEPILFIVSHYELGLLGIKIKTNEIITGVAENYSLKIKPGAKVKIYEPEPEMRETFLIRAIIEIMEKNQCEIIYTLPTFFKQLNI
ncbi:MAG: hypothetical protein ACTSYC_04150 [Promethearchaeota archaeon]